MNLAGLGTYLRTFSIYFAVGLVIVGMLTQVFSLQGIVPISAAMVFVGAYAAIARFVQEHARVPEQAEKWKLVGMSLALAWLLLAAVLFGAVFTVHGTAAAKELLLGPGIGIWLLIVLVVSPLYLGILYVVYTWLARKLLAKLNEPKPTR